MGHKWNLLSMEVYGWLVAPGDVDALSQAFVNADFGF